jgi:hypothetical protein
MSVAKKQMILESEKMFERLKQTGSLKDPEKPKVYEDLEPEDIIKKGIKQQKEKLKRFGEK